MRAVAILFWLVSLSVKIKSGQAYYGLDTYGCFLFSSTGMCGGCEILWPYMRGAGACGGGVPCDPCKNGREMDELCRCTEKCPLGKWGRNCDRNCEYKCRACNRDTGDCEYWCSELCLDGCQLTTGYCALNLPDCGRGTICGIHYPHYNPKGTLTTGCNHTFCGAGIGVPIG